MNNRPVAPINLPRTLRPKAMPVSPIKSQVGNVVPQAVFPVITSQGQNQYMMSGNVVPQVYQGASISQAVGGTQTTMPAQQLYQQNPGLPISQPRMAIFRQNAAVSQTEKGVLSQTVSGSQKRLGAPVMSPQMGKISQNSSLSQSQINAQVWYPQMPLKQSNAPIVQSSVPVVQKINVPLAQSGIQVVPNCTGMLVSAAPVYQTMSFQPRQQIGFQTQINPPIQTGQQFAFQSQIASNVTSPVFRPTVTNIANPFQQNFPVSNAMTLNKAYITSQNQLAVSQVASQLVGQPNISPRFIQINQPPRTVQSQVLHEMKPAPEVKNIVKLNQVRPNEGPAEPDLEGSSSSSSDDTFKVLVKPATIIVKPSVSEPNKKDCSESADLTEIFEVTGLQQLQADSDSYTEMTPENSLLSDAQFGLSEEKNSLQDSPFVSSGQESMVTSDNSHVEMDSQDSTSGMSNHVTPSDIDEFLSLPSTFDPEVVTQTNNPSADSADSSLDSEYTEMTIEQTSVVDGRLSLNEKEKLSYTPEVLEPLVEQGEKIQSGKESDSSADVLNQMDDQLQDKAANQAERSADNVSDFGQSAKRSFIGNTRYETQGEKSSLLQNKAEVAEEVPELKDTESLHSGVDNETKRNSAVASETFCQVCSSENSLDGAMSTDLLDLYTDDSNSITWENFHETVLNLRANKDRGNNEVPFDIVSKHAHGIKLIGCDKEFSDSGSKDDDENAESKEKEDGLHEQSFEGEEEEPEFIWEDYLQQTGTIAVPATAFKHVEHSLQSGFIRGMKLEVPNKSDSSTFWVATVLMTCGPLLRLRYDGYGEDSSGDFWCDLNTTEVHPIGWSAQNEKSLQPPDEIRDKVSDWRSFLLESLTGARTAPSYFFEKGAALSPVDQLKCGMKLELQDALNPQHVWLVQILENVGGRLYLRLEGTQSACKHFWMFYLNHRLHPIGWTSEHEGCIYRPPKDIYDEQTDETWTEILQTALKECEEDLIPVDVFKDQQELKQHQFAVGMKLEALIPGLNMIGPATVTKVINNMYFIVEIDDLRSEEKRESVQICCNSEYLGIFPVSWCQCKGIRLSPPQGWQGGDFVWGEYLSFCNAKAAPEKLFHSGTDDHDFERGMKLEAVNPNNPNQICAATITKIVGPLLWIHLDHMRDIPSHIEDIDSHNLFPVGWCESNNYQLKPPVKARPRQRRQSESKTEEVYRSVTSSQTKGAWCPKIHLNHKCFSGPYLSKGRISDLPKYVGPGPMDLVLREVLSLLISIAYVPCRALKEIQQEGPFNPNMKAHILKAKYKGKKYKAVVEVCQNESQLEEYCRNMCIKLECCPYLFSPLNVRNNCPENCQQLTKTKSNPYYVKKRKPSSFVSVKPILPLDGNGETKKRGRKRKSFLYTHKKGQGHRAHDNGGDLKDEGFIDDYDEDGMIPSERKVYDIQTRGAKLPKYSFERKSHRKILMTQAISHVNKHKPGYKRLLPKGWPINVRQERPLIPREGSLKLESNPLHWTVAEVVQFLKTTDCSHLARIMKEQEVDGQAFLLLNLSTIQEHLELKLGPAVKLCHQIERLKLAFYENYA